MRPEALSRQTVSVSSDSVAVRDQTDEKTVHLFDSNTGKPLGDGRPYVHRQEVVEVALEQTGPPHERKLAIIDKNRDLHLVTVRRLGAGSGKLGAMVASLRWSSDCSMLAAMQDSRFTLWYYPTIISVDRALLNRWVMCYHAVLSSCLMTRTLVERDSAEFGKYPVITSFENNSVSVRKGDGSLVTTGVSPYPAILHGYVTSQHWDDATKLCRFVKVNPGHSC